VTGEALSAEGFLAGLALQARNGYAGTRVASPEGAGMVDLVNLGRPRNAFRGGSFARMWPGLGRSRHKQAAHEGLLAVRREVMADIDTHSVGALFRFDTPHGPLSNFDPLFVAAGGSGSRFGLVTAPLQLFARADRPAQTEARSRLPRPQQADAASEPTSRSPHTEFVRCRGLRARGAVGSASFSRSPAHRMQR
jgi:hypothetical protein